MAAESKMERLLESQGIEFERNVKFHPNEDWTFDFVVDEKIAIELKDSQEVSKDSTWQKQNAAMLRGWSVLQYVEEQINKKVISDILLLRYRKLNEQHNPFDEAKTGIAINKINNAVRKEIEKSLVALKLY